MPHQCVRCQAMYDDDAIQVIRGCTCGGQAFFFIRELQEPAQEDAVPVQSDTEGKYDLDLHALFAQDKRVYKEEDGKYRVDLAMLLGRR